MNLKLASVFTIILLTSAASVQAFGLPESPPSEPVEPRDFFQPRPPSVGSWKALAMNSTGHFGVTNRLFEYEEEARTMAAISCRVERTFPRDGGDCRDVTVSVLQDWTMVGYFCERGDRSAPFVAASRYDYYTARINASKKIEEAGYSIADDCDLVHRSDAE